MNETLIFFKNENIMNSTYLFQQVFLLVETSQKSSFAYDVELCRHISLNILHLPNLTFEINFPLINTKNPSYVR